VVAKPGAAPIRLVARQEAWVEIKDATGKLLQFGTVKGGQVLELSGTPPFAYTIGKASEVSLEFEGKPVDLKPVTLMPANIAKGRLP
jgi:cytoskeleton protein RodZ